MASTLAIIHYQVKPDSTDHFLDLVKGVSFQEAVMSYPGFIAYNLVRVEGDLWCEYIVWESKQAAIEGARLSQSTPANMALQPYQILSSFDVKFLEIAVGIGQ